MSHWAYLELDAYMVVIQKSPKFIEGKAEIVWQIAFGIIILISNMSHRWID